MRAAPPAPSFSLIAACHVEQSHLTPWPVIFSPTRL